MNRDEGSEKAANKDGNELQWKEDKNIFGVWT